MQLQAKVGVWHVRGVGQEQDCISTLPSLQQCDAHYATNLWYALCYVVCIIVSLREGQRLRLHSLELHTVGGCLQTSVQVVHCLQGGDNRCCTHRYRCSTTERRELVTFDSPFGALLSLFPSLLAPNAVVPSVIPPATM